MRADGIKDEPVDKQNRNIVVICNDSVCVDDCLGCRADVRDTDYNANLGAVTLDLVKGWEKTLPVGYSVQTWNPV